MLAELEIELLASPRLIKALISAMALENYGAKRCSMQLNPRSDRRGLVLKFSAPDLPSLRACLNTNLRLISASIKAIDSVKRAA